MKIDFSAFYELFYGYLLIDIYLYLSIYLDIKELFVLKLALQSEMERQKGREGLRETERASSICWFGTLQWLALGQAEARSEELHLGFHVDVWVPSVWAIFSCLSQAIVRELDQKRSKQRHTCCATALAH